MVDVMYKCIANKENLFLVLDTNDGVCEWATIQECRDYLEGGIKIEGLSLKNIDASHSFVDFNPDVDFVPTVIDDEVKMNCKNKNEYMKIIYTVKNYIMKGGNIITLRNASGSFQSFKQRLERCCYNGQYVTTTAEV